MTEKPSGPEIELTDEAFHKALQNTVLQAHSGTVLTRTAVIDANLGILIQLRMPNLSNRLRDRLFEGYGPIATFSARIDIAYALGAIDQDTRKILSAIREIRNEFAHNRDGVHFEHEKIKKLLAKLPTPSDREEGDNDYITFIRVASALHNQLAKQIYTEQGRAP